MSLIEAIEVFAFVSGLAYIVLEILQKNAMWVIGILTGIACAWSFHQQQLYASMGLNLYYVGMSVVGLWQWRKAGKDTPEGALHLEKPSARTWWISGAVFVVGSLALIVLLHRLGDSESAMDAIVTVLSAIATWWLAKSYPQQWFLWIAADLLSTALCLSAGLYWMAVLYLAYTGSAVLGYLHWVRNGRYKE